MTSHTTSTLTYKRDGTYVSATINHPAVDPHRKEAIDYFATNNCRIGIDSEDVPPWLAELDSEIQEEIVKNHLELTNLYSLRIPESATIRSEQLRLLNHMADLKHLYIAFPCIAPDDMRFLACLVRLEILTLIGKAFGDDHLAHLPGLANIKMIDIQTTAVTASVARRLQEEYPTAKIYC